MINVLAALKIGDGLWPKFASLLALELYQGASDGQFYVRLVYNSKVVTSKLLGCENSGDLCSFSIFQVCSPDLAIAIQP